MTSWIACSARSAWGSDGACLAGLLILASDREAPHLIRQPLQPLLGVVQLILRHGPGAARDVPDVSDQLVQNLAERRGGGGRRGPRGECPARPDPGGAGGGGGPRARGGRPRTPAGSRRLHAAGAF